MTGTDRRVKISVVSPQVTPHVTFRPVLDSSSWAIAIRAERVSSRNRRIRPDCPSAEPDSGALMVPTMVISSRSPTTVKDSNQSSGSRPSSQPVMRVFL